MSDLLALIRGGEPAPSTYIHQRSSKLPKPPRVPGTEQPVIEEPRKRRFFRSLTSRVSNHKNAAQTPPQSPPPNPPWIIEVNASATSLPSMNASMRYMSGVQMERRGSMQIPGMERESTPPFSRLATTDGRFVPSSSRPNTGCTCQSVSSTHPRQECSNSPPRSWDSSVLTTPALIMPSASTSVSGHADDLLEPPPAYSQRSSFNLALGLKAHFLSLPAAAPLENTLASDLQTSLDTQSRDKLPTTARSPYPTAEQKAAAIAALESSRRKTNTGPPLSSFLEL